MTGPATPAGGRAIYRYEVPADDLWHPANLSGDIIHVATRTHDQVEVWAVHGSHPPVRRWLRVVGTGQPLPDLVRHVGTALTPPAFGIPINLVWHLIESVTAEGHPRDPEGATAE